jgi:REP element-mobilizing transposase RayT
VPTKPRRKKPPVQLKLPGTSTWGGRRDKAGRKRGRNQSHTRRPPVARSYPVHVTIRFLNRKSLRQPWHFSAVKRVLTDMRSKRPFFGVAAYSVQENHLHMIVEADGPEAFASGIRSIAIRLAKRLNRSLGRTGRLFKDRHHRHVLKSPLEVRNALAYVLLNRRKHLQERGGPLGSQLDAYSSSRWFDGWSEPVRSLLYRSRQLLPDSAPVLVSPARTWLVQIGWHRDHARIGPLEVPG